MSTCNHARWRPSHHYRAPAQAAERRAWLVVALTGGTMLAEIGAGYWFNSMALLADGWHMASHMLAIGLAALAYWLARRHADAMAQVEHVGAVLRGARLDALVIVGDDQKELFFTDLQPSVLIYHGATIRNAPLKDRPGPRWAYEASRRFYEPEAPRDYPVHQALAQFLVAELVRDEFDIVSSDTLPEGPGRMLGLRPLLPREAGRRACGVGVGAGGVQPDRRVRSGKRLVVAFQVYEHARTGGVVDRLVGVAGQRLVHRLQRARILVLAAQPAQRQPVQRVRVAGHGRQGLQVAVFGLGQAALLEQLLGADQAGLRAGRNAAHVRIPRWLSTSL